MRWQFTTAIVLLSGALVSAGAQLRPRDRYAITAEQVAAKLATSFADKGVVLNASQIALPASVSATEQEPALEVRSVGSLGTLRNESAASTSSAVKLACSSPKICLPFYAVVTLPTGGQNSVARVNPLIPAVLASRGQTVMKSGAHVTLLIQSGATHIQMSVISMESGTLHQQISVRSADRKQTYKAEVLDASTVRGTY